MSRLRLLTVVALAFSMLAVTAAPAFGQALPRPTTWVDGELFNGVVTPATFDPASDPFDELYNAAAVGCSFLGGAPLISESKPGDQDYNGGRWHLNILVLDDTPGSIVDCDTYKDATSVEDLDTNDFMSTDAFFECPLLPRRGNN